MESAGAKAPAITISTQQIIAERAQMRLLSERGKASYSSSIHIPYGSLARVKTIATPTSKPTSESISDGKLTAVQAKNHVGKNATVCGVVAIQNVS